MRKLLFGSLILAGLTCIASADSQTPASWADSPPVQNSIAHDLVYMQRELALTPEQVAQVKAAMEAGVHGTATKTAVQVLHEICTPARFNAWEQMELQRRLPYDRREATYRAAFETDQVEKTTLLSAKQRPQVEAAFYQIELADRAFRYTDYTKATLEAHLAQVAADRENALDKILTPAQIEKRTRIATAGLTKPLPDLPTLSLATTSPAGSYGWVSDGAAP